MKRILFVILLVALSAEAYPRKAGKRVDDREVWCEILYKIAEPVLKNMSRGELQKKYAGRDLSVVGRSSGESYLHGMFWPSDGRSGTVALSPRRRYR